LLANVDVKESGAFVLKYVVTIWCDEIEWYFKYYTKIWCKL